MYFPTKLGWVSVPTPHKNGRHSCEAQVLSEVHFEHMKHSIPTSVLRVLEQGC